MRDFYQKLFQNDDVALCETNQVSKVWEVHVKQLSINESLEIEGPLTLLELSNSLKAMKNGKCPGIDGFPAEFLKVFWIKLKYFILRSLNYSYEHGEMLLSLRQCIINCLPKGHKSRQFLKNWRPISLLSIIYKLGSSAIANRIKKYMNKLISPEQSGFISGRYIGDNTRLIYDLMYCCENSDITGLLMLVDFQKG